MIDCCKAPREPKRQGNQILCNQCGREGRPVDRVTVEALLKTEALGEVRGKEYMFCETPHCPIVYYAADRTEFEKNQVRVRVGVKETEDPVPVCYCFGVTERMIHEEIQGTGRSSASARIRAEVKAGNCRCEVENPSGRCCLGDVIRAEKQATADIKGAASPAKSSKSAMAGSSAMGLLAAFLASICCIGPVVFAALGVGVGATGFLAGAAGFLKALLPYRPAFISLTGLLVGISFYLAYRKPKTACAPGGLCRSEEAPGSKRAWLWMMAAIALALVLAPYWLGQ